METNGIIMIAVAVISMFFGYGFGWLEWGRKLKELENQPKPDNTPSLRQAARVETPPAEPGLLSLRETGGRLIVELEGRPLLDAYTTPPEQRKRLVEVVTRLRPWMESRSAAPLPTPPPAPMMETFLAPETAPAVAAQKPASKKKEETVAPLSMVAQIDEILQKNILGTPLGKLGLKLMETPGGGVTVVVGLQRYAGLGEVPDPEVQAALRAAIAEWEKKFTPV